MNTEPLQSLGVSWGSAGGPRASALFPTSFSSLSVFTPERGPIREGCLEEGFGQSLEGRSREGGREVEGFNQGILEQKHRGGRARGVPGTQRGALRMDWKEELPDEAGEACGALVGGQGQAGVRAGSTLLAAGPRLCGNI